MTKKPQVKICGIRREEDLMILKNYPVDYIGFIFAESKRRVTIDEARQLATKVPDGVKKVGVFVDAPLEFILEAAKVANLDVIQLHGSETVDSITKIPYPVWKSIPIEDETSFKEIPDYQKVCDGILLETKHKTLKGGTGQSFDWNLVKHYKREDNVAFILAGGLKPETIRMAIELVAPDIIDINSGVEVDGYKSQIRIHQLFKELKL